MTNELSTERAIEALYTVRAYYASLTAGYPKGKDCKGIGDVMCSEIANSCLMAIKALELMDKISKRDIERFSEMDYTDGYNKGWVDCKKVLEQQPSEDCVSRQEVISGIDRYIDKAQSTGIKDDFISFEELVVKQLPSVTPQQTRWIPVSERLPKENEYIKNVCKYYLIQDEYGDMHVAHLSNVGWIPMDSLKAIGDEVIAWRELPQSYKECEEE